MKEDTVVYDKDGKLVGSVNAGRYKYAEIKSISPYLYNGYIAVEDKRFKTHGGVDLLATMRAGVALVKNGGDIKQGGSTITQQLAKNVFLSNEQTYERKVREMFLAVELEKKYTKDEIMEFYMNNICFGNAHFGIEAASIPGDLRRMG